ncbi:dual specificity protein phosphatase 7-like isoform X1 [Ornithodoros turicata]|uniref:dual specificity protein phosphatase 7-like isoform X1 n=1 Tax=Ornithodoros turicata TaxID=34597 RepID=UPI00313A1E6C
MPSLDYSAEMSGSSTIVPPEWVVCRIRDPTVELLVLDCRSPDAFARSRVRGALGVSLPASVLMLRRLADGKLCVSSVVREPRYREWFKSRYRTVPIVLYDSEGLDSEGQVSNVLLQRLRQDGCEVYSLQAGGFAEFRSRCPEWCESGTNDGSGDVLGSSTPTSAAALLGLETLRISVVPLDPLVTGDVEDRCDSGLARDDSPSGAADPPFPVQIIPFLFLGNEENSTDLEALERNNIRYVLNVTHNLANAFEGLDRGIKYMKIPIEDHWSQNLSSFFPQAIAFIDEARQKRVGVLVHCLAGVSRSVTVTLAYLMQKHKMPLNDAYDFVKKRKANIAPNFNFLGQLLDFENLLNLKPSHCFCGGSPASSDEGIVRPTSCRCRTLHFTSPTRTTPDSGIDLDRWT